MMPFSSYDPHLPPGHLPVAGKVVLTVHSFGLGGTDRVCAHLARGFAAAGFQTHVAALARGGKAERALVELLGPDVHVHFLGDCRRWRFLDLILGLTPLTRYIKHQRPDCVISTGNNINWMTAMAVGLSRLASCRLVLKTTNPILRPKDGPFKRWFRTIGYAWAFRAADQVWTLSHAETRQLQQVFPAVSDRFHTVINPYVSPEMLVAGHAGMPRTGPALVIAVGRLASQKRLDRLVEAFALIPAEKARLVILGEGKKRRDLAALIDALGLHAQVAMPGYATDISDWYGRADLLVLPSVYEGLPAVVLEAMAANCPVVSTDCFPIARELMTDGEACALLRSCAPADIAEAILHSIDQPRPTALAQCAARYSIANGIDSHVESLSRLLAEAVPSGQSYGMACRTPALQKSMPGAPG